MISKYNVTKFDAVYCTQYFKHCKHKALKLRASFQNIQHLQLVDEQVAKATKTKTDVTHTYIHMYTCVCMLSGVVTGILKIFRYNEKRVNVSNNN